MSTSSTTAAAAAPQEAAKAADSVAHSPVAAAKVVSVIADDDNSYHSATTTAAVPRRPVPRFLAALDRARTPADKERLMFRFAAVMDTVFFDLPAAPSSRDGNALERDIQSLLETIFSTLQTKVPDEFTIEPPARFAALRALGAFVQGTAPIPTVLSEDWKGAHVPLYLAALKLLGRLFEKGTTQFVFAIRCLSVLAIQALQVLQPLDPVDVAVSSILSSPARNRGAAGSFSSPKNDNATTTSLGLLNDSIMQAPATAQSASAAAPSVTLPSGTPLRVTPASGTTIMVSSIGAASNSSPFYNSPMRSNMNNNSSVSPSSFLNFESLFMDHLLSDPILRPLVLELWRSWDAAGIDIRVFTAAPEALHVYMPGRLLSSVSCVFRDFITCPERPRMEKPWRGMCEIHIKTNISVHSEVMYRILIEGYNYGVNSPIQCEVVGCAKRHWDAPGGGDVDALARMCRDYSDGCGSTQYFSSDGKLVIKLVASSFFGVGFTASAWMVFHGHSPGFAIDAEVFHQEEML